MSSNHSPRKGTQGIQHIFKATCYSITGFKAVFRHEAAFRQILGINLILIPMSFLLPVNLVEQTVMVAVCLLAIIVELFNSAIAAFVDRISVERHELSKNTKDMGSAAQFVALVLIATTWGRILIGDSI